MESPVFDCDETFESNPKWTVLDALIWKVWPESFGGSKPHLMAYKNAWIIFNCQCIIDTAFRFAIPADLLGCVAFNEVGGDPPFVKEHIVLPIRQFDHSGPNWVEEHLTITRLPLATSEGAIKIQLGVAAKVLGVQIELQGHEQMATLVTCLETDVFNLAVVARLLHELILHDYPNADTRALSDEQFSIAGSRYNRGVQRALPDLLQSLEASPGDPVRQYTSYGRSMQAHRSDIRQLLGMAP